MSVNFVWLALTIFLFLVDILLTRYVKQKGIFLEITKYKVKYVIACLLGLLLIYVFNTKKYLLLIACLSLLQIADRLIFLYKGNKR